MPAARTNGSPAAVWPQEQEPIICHCWAWRHGEMADHVDHTATLKRDRRLGLVLDEVWFAALEIEARLDPAELSA